MNQPLTQTRPRNYCTITTGQPGCYLAEPTECLEIRYYRTGEILKHVLVGVVCLILMTILIIDPRPVSQFICSCLLIIPACSYFGFFIDHAIVTYHLQHRPGLTAIIIYSMGNIPELFISVMALAHQNTTITQHNTLGSGLVNLVLVSGLVALVWKPNHTTYPRAVLGPEAVLPPVNPLNPSVTLPSQSQTELPVASPTQETKLVTNPTQLLGLLATPYIWYSVFSLVPKQTEMVQHFVAVALPVSYLWLVGQGHLNHLFQGSLASRTTPRQYARPGGASDYLPECQACDRCLSIFMVSMGSLVGLVWLAYLCDAIIRNLEPARNILGLSERLVSFIVVPLVSNVVEIYQAYRVAKRGELVSGLSVALGSVIQILWLVYPALHLAGWASGHPLPLTMGRWSAILLGVGGLIYLVGMTQELLGWLHRTGILLVMWYLFGIAVSFG